MDHASHNGLKVLYSVTSFHFISWKSTLTAKCGQLGTRPCVEDIARPSSPDLPLGVKVLFHSSVDMNEMNTYPVS